MAIQVEENVSGEIASESARRGNHKDLMDIARLAYIYGLPCYEMAHLRFQAVIQGKPAQQMGLNRLQHQTALTTAKTGRVTHTNADMLKSSAWLDLSQGPLRIYVPGHTERYYSLALMDFFTNNFAVLGRRLSGTIHGDFLLIGPGWDGHAPPGITTIHAPTKAVWALIRILVSGGDDLAAARKFQN
jgi:hypothetical protein